MIAALQRQVAALQVDDMERTMMMMVERRGMLKMPKMEEKMVEMTKWQLIWMLLKLGFKFKLYYC